MFCSESRRSKSATAKEEDMSPFPEGSPALGLCIVHSLCKASPRLLCLFASRLGVGINYRDTAAKALGMMPRVAEVGCEFRSCNSVFDISKAMASMRIMASNGQIGIQWCRVLNYRNSRIMATCVES